MAERYVHVELFNYLRDLGIVRRPGEAGTAPVCYINEPDGPPQASAGEPVIVHLLQTPGFAKGALEEFVEYPTIDVTIRALNDDSAVLLAWETARKIVRALDGNRAFQMGSIEVGLSTVWRDFGQMLDGLGNAGIRLVGSFAFQVRTAQLSA